MLEILFKCPCCHRNVDAQSTHVHHILPRSLGGGEYQSNRIEICEECHGAIHSNSFDGRSKLIKTGLEKARSRGVKLGRKRLCDEKIQNSILVLREDGLSMRLIAKKLGISYGVVFNTVHLKYVVALNPVQFRKNIKKKEKRQVFLLGNVNRCGACEKNSDDISLHAHHILPLAVGGVDDHSNIATLCEDCHGKIHGIAMTGLSRLVKAGLASSRAKGIQMGRKKKVTRELAEFILKSKDKQGLSFGQIKKAIDAEDAYGKKGIPITTIKHAYTLASKNGLDSYLTSAELISSKVKQGLIKARARGVKLGQPAIDQETMQSIKADRQQFGLSYRALAKKYGVSFGTAYKACGEGKPT